PDRKDSTWERSRGRFGRRFGTCERTREPPSRSELQKVSARLRPRRCPSRHGAWPFLLSNGAWVRPTLVIRRERGKRRLMCLHQLRPGLVRTGLRLPVRALPAEPRLVPLLCGVLYDACHGWERAEEESLTHGERRFIRSTAPGPISHRTLSGSSLGVRLLRPRHLLRRRAPA